MKKLTEEELNNILDLHKKWLNKKKGGKRANLCEANLIGANLDGADLSGANLKGADLYMANLAGAYLGGANLAGANLADAILIEANLSNAILAGANFRKAYLRGANLAEADLRRANLFTANLRYTCLSGADLTGANLSDSILDSADLTNAILPDFQIPQDKDLIGWKKIEKGTLVKLKIPKKAKRTGCLRSNKCRAEYAKVLEIIGEGRCSIFYKYFIYEVGKIVKPTSYNDDIREDCKPGIHFFMTKEEAEGYTIIHV